MKLAIFLRGINVNGITIKMDDLKKVMEELQYQQVRTILASGNILVTAMDTEIAIEKHKHRMEEALSKKFSYEAFLFIKTTEQICNMIEEASTHKVPEGYHHYVLLSDDNGIDKRLKQEFELCQKEESEQLITGEYGVYWIVPKGNTLKSEFGKKVLGKREFKSLITSRTMNTIDKMKQYMLDNN